MTDDESNHTNPRDLIQELLNAWEHELGDLADSNRLVKKVRAYLEEIAPVRVKEQRPDRLVVGDIWEFETEVKVKGKRKLQAVTLQWVVKGYYPGECAWQLQSLDEQYYVYLWEHAPQYEEMAYIGTKKGTRH
jgi:hypothetical protein